MRIHLNYFRRDLILSITGEITPPVDNYQEPTISEEYRKKFGRSIPNVLPGDVAGAEKSGKKSSNNDASFSGSDGRFVR